jgi:tetratricopeptide (TPR) repeat protein
MTLGRFEEAVAEIRRAQELDPVSLYISRNVGQILYFARRYDEAIEALRKTLDLDPNFRGAYEWIAKSLEQQGNYNKSIEVLTEGGSPEAMTFREVYARSGWRGFWQKLLERKKEISKHDYVGADDFASIYARLGEENQVFGWLDKACDEQDLYILTLKVDPIWDRYRSNPRFDRLLRRIGLAP